MSCFKCKNQVFVADNPQARIPMGSGCLCKGDLWINPALCLIYVFMGSCWKLITCPSVTIENPPCNAQLVWYDGALKAGQLIDTQATIPANAEVVFCGADGLSLGFLPSAPSGCTALTCDTTFLTFDQATQTTGCGSLSGPTLLPCAPQLVFCDPTNGLSLGSITVQDPPLVPCAASLLFCDGTSVVQSQVPADQAPLQCDTDLFLVCGGTAGIVQRSVFDNGFVPCLAELLFCQADQGLSRGVIGSGTPLGCTAAFVVCQNGQWSQASIEGVGGTLAPNDQVLYCNAQSQLAFGAFPAFPTTEALAAQKTVVSNPQPAGTPLMSWSAANFPCNDFGAAWTPATGQFVVPTNGLYEVNVTGVVQIQTPSVARLSNYTLGIDVNGSQANEPGSALGWLFLADASNQVLGSYVTASCVFRLTAGQVITITLGLANLIGTGQFLVQLDLTIKRLP